MLAKLKVTKLNALLIAIVLAVTLVTLFAFGRTPICECGFIKIWHGQTISSENSQHLFDLYSLTHLGHGILVYFILLAIFRNASFGSKLVIGVGIESLWEVVENTDYVINLYRTATISLNYFGDSIINSFGDILMMVIGFSIANILPAIFTVVLFLLVELFLAYYIRDNLTLNILMLIKPNAQIKEWQSGKTI